MQKPQVEDDNNKAMRGRKRGRQVPMQKPIVGRRQQQKKEREVSRYLFRNLQVEEGKNKAMRERKREVGRQVPMQKPIVGRRGQQQSNEKRRLYVIAPLHIWFVVVVCRTKTD